MKKLRCVLRRLCSTERFLDETQRRFFVALNEIFIFAKTAVDDEQCVGVFSPCFAKFKFFREKMILSLFANKDE